MLPDTTPGETLTAEEMAAVVRMECDIETLVAYARRCRLISGEHNRCGMITMVDEILSRRCWLAPCEN